MPFHVSNGLSDVYKRQSLSSKLGIPKGRSLLLPALGMYTRLVGCGLYENVFILATNWFRFASKSFPYSSLLTLSVPDVYKRQNMYYIYK